ncbi:MAG: DnaA N-terminal domain-containing protein, partial [Methanoregula sp.]|uniref:DnaA N-terminal domain-containing protein n=1 Tax=Methanoregula sp. TaxID=2052170 RepID=UPI003D109F06
MEPEQAWQSALGQLQLEMPKATFDTWVRDTRVVSYEDGRFVIGARNLYTRDWLEGRLSSTANRLLMGIMNRSVEVEFVVAESGSNESENFEPEADDQAGSEESILEEDSGPTGDDKVLIEARYDLAYDEIVKPKHITATSRYFLHHLQVIGPDLGWLYLGFRQAAYN